MTPDRPGYWWLGDEVAEVSVRGLDPGLECALCGDDVHMPVECYDDWRGPVATPDEVEALRGSLAASETQRDEAIRLAVSFAEMEIDAIPHEQWQAWADGTRCPDGNWYQFFTFILAVALHRHPEARNFNTTAIKLGDAWWSFSIQRHDGKTPGERLTELQAERDEAQAEVQRLRDAADRDMGDRIEQAWQAEQERRRRVAESYDEHHTECVPSQNDHRVGRPLTARKVRP